METDHDLRASDADRQSVVDRLRGALEAGRLSVDEFSERMERAYRARTYGELAVLHADLPAADAGPHPAAPGGRASNPLPWAPLPGALRALWTAWLIAVSINVVVWVLVCATSVALVYPWPIWVAGPWGAVLLAKSLAFTGLRRAQI